ncbi:hypothetical protein ACLOJK_009593, partial [Asimina triloba]
MKETLRPGPGTWAKATSTNAWWVLLPTCRVQASMSLPSPSHVPQLKGTDVARDT